MIFKCSFPDKNFEIIEEGNMAIDENNGKILEGNEGYGVGKNLNYLIFKSKLYF